MAKKNLTALTDEKPAPQERLAKPQKQVKMTKSYRFSQNTLDKIESLRIRFGRESGRVPSPSGVIERLVDEAGM